MYGLSLQQRIQLGLTIEDCADLLQRSRQIHSDFDAQEPQHQVVTMLETWHAVNTSPAAAPLVPGAIDWDRVFTFLERLLPFLLKIWGAAPTPVNPGPPTAGAKA